MDDQASEPRHYTRQPWWVIPLAAVVVALLPLLKFGKFYAFTRKSGLSLLEGFLFMGAAGAVGASILVISSHIRSSFWSHTVLVAGILLVAVMVSAVSVLLAM